MIPKLAVDLAEWSLLVLQQRQKAMVRKEYQRSAFWKEVVSSRHVFDLPDVGQLFASNLFLRDLSLFEMQKLQHGNYVSLLFQFLA